MRKGIAVRAREIKGIAFALLGLFACGFVGASLGSPALAQAPAATQEKVLPNEVRLKSPTDAWLAESLTEYLTWRDLIDKQPEQGRSMVERAVREALAQQPLCPLALGLRMVTLQDRDVVHAALYSRGMLVWRTLETVIDRERVDRALREYYKRFRGQSASIDDFRRICEEISGRDLKWFFDYYITGTRLPEIEIRRLPGSAPGEFAGEIVVRNAPPEFQVRVEMSLQTAKGVVEHSVATRGAVTPFTVNVPDTVTRVILDPRQRILRKTESPPRQP